MKNVFFLLIECNKRTYSIIYQEKKIRYKNHTSKHIFFKKCSFPKRVNVARVDEKKRRIQYTIPQLNNYFRRKKRERVQSVR